MDVYNKFAYLYDELMNDFDYELWFNYIEDIFDRYNKKPINVLEMACGTGNLSYYLAKKGYKLTCFDLSSDMLSKAYEKLNRFRNVKLLNQNMITFNLKQKYDSVISICDSINYIINKDDLLNTFKNVWNHLDEDGIFIFDINSYFKLSKIIGNNTFVEDRDDLFYTWQNYFDEEREIAEFYLTFFYSEDGENYVRFDEEHKEKAYKIETIIQLLNLSGFSKIHSFEGFSFNDVNDHTERINFVAFK